MKRRYRFAPKAAHDLVQIWRYLRKEAGSETADRVERTILDKVSFLGENPYAGHLRQDLTSLPLRFFPVHSYLIAYRPDTKPIQVVAILHGNRDLLSILRNRP